MVLLPVCHRLHPKPVFPRTCRIVQNSECGEDHIFIAVVPERNILVWLSAGHYSAYGAYYYVHTGEAYNFHQEYLERVEKLLGDEDDVQLQPYHYKPWFLCMGDLSEDENNEANRSLAIWYDKDSVTLISED